VQFPRATRPAAGDWGFSDGIGLFYDEEQYEGRDVTVRYKWFDITATFRLS
jgi:hypothetical protein